MERFHPLSHELATAEMRSFTRSAGTHAGAKKKALFALAEDGSPGELRSCDSWASATHR